MTNEQIKRLSELARRSELYFFDHGICERVIAFIPQWVENEGDEPEPAFMLANRTHVALWNTEARQFALISRLTESALE